MIKHRKAAVLVLLTVMLLSVTVFSSAAYADGKPKATPTPTPTATPQPTTAPTPIPTPVSSGAPFTNEGNMALIDNLFAKATNKQFITVESKSGQLFYIVIDYDAMLNEETDSYEVHFLNMVDEADLMALLEEGEIPVKTPEPTIKPTPNIEVIKDEDEKSGGLGGGAILLILLLLAGGAAVYYFKVLKKKPKPKVPVDTDAYDLEDDEDDEPWEKEI